MSSKLSFVKWVRFFEQNCIVKWVIFFTSFCWLWDFLLENLERNNFDNVHWKVWTNIKKLFSRNNVFKKGITNMQFWIIYILVQISFFGGLVLGCFSHHLFLVFYRRPTMVVDIFTQPPPPTTIENFPTALIYFLRQNHGIVNVVAIGRKSLFLFQDHGVVDAVMKWKIYIYIYLSWSPTYWK